MILSKFLSAPDRRKLLACVKPQREDHGVARHANALLLFDDATVRGWHTQYLAERSEATGAFNSNRATIHCLAMLERELWHIFLRN